LAILVAATLFILFWRLDSIYLWRDEATTATWARTMVENRSLVPYVFDGETLAAQGFDAHDFNEHLTPGMQGWLQFYVTAISFQLFGVSTFTARLPFAFAGLVSTGVMFLIGRRLYPGSRLAFLFPTLTITSIWFLTATRQTRYYGLSFLFGTLVLYEFIRLLQDRGVADKLSWYLRVSAWSAGVYLSNYLGFAGMYATLCLFVLLLGDRKFLFRWSTMTAILAVLFGAEFFTFHFDFASSWGSSAQPWESTDWTIWDKLRIARNMHSEENFRMIPLLFLIPGLFYLFRSRDEAASSHGWRIPNWTAGLCVFFAVVIFFAKGTQALTWITIALTFVLAAVALRTFQNLRRRAGAPSGQEDRALLLLPVILAAMVAYGLGVNHTPENLLLYLCAELLILGLTVFALLRLRPTASQPLTVPRGLALLTVLMIVISIAVTIGVGLDKGLARYYYHVLAACIVLAGMVTAELHRRGQRGMATVFFLGFLIWPNISYHIASSFGLPLRQFMANQTIDIPVVEFLRKHGKPGESFVVYRNVQGMMLHFYLPEMRWVGQLDSTNPHALHFRDRLPASAYDDVNDVDWYCVWDNYGRNPRGLDDRYEKVWDYTYRYPLPWWDSKQGTKDERRWRIYRRKTGADAQTTPATPPGA
jgi:hypothetical protein